MIRFLIIMVLVVVGDQLSKLWILENFALYESTVVIPGFFNLTFLRNSGAAFGMLSDMPLLWRQIFFISIAVVALVALIVMQRKMGRENIWYTLALSFIGGGAVGNVIDRVRDGSVVDFLDVYIGKYHWPAFNVADSGICVGVTIFLLLQVFEGDGKQEEKLE
ncbi:signal peptidase II Aspartic peptidase, MEROPS family A08 [Candidatus Electrothrix aarhusensis]|uniref:Lipoprotein signal peptidase n=1 Tax=Candidatus Electrothrix aarhusensis TaxID=1859131 RepID=A0A3S3SNQ5_9BACT|nr:signal peptidase II Aspartic peptidase, MEROPS family A08 [Candidatus Electrothrix aarhusensis]